MTKAKTKITGDGVVIGMLMGFDGESPLVVFAGNAKDEAIPARSTAHLDVSMVGSEVALMFEDGDRARPLIMGRIVTPARSKKSPKIISDGELVSVNAQKKLELRCGKASIVMYADGRVTVRGTEVVSQASRRNTIRGGSITLN
jgi:Domain of unknown function (DUF6484)